MLAARSRVVRRAVGVAALSLVAVHAPAQGRPLGVWRVERGVSAPWVRQGVDRADTKAWVGRTVRFEASRVRGPGVLNCGRARFESASQPAEGLFQGGLPAPARSAAEQLGIVRFPVPGVLLTCDAGSFDFHRVDGTTMLIAVDNVIWTLSRSAGALLPATSPSGVVQVFLERHFAGDMGFDTASVADKQGWLTASLRAAIAAYLARPGSPNEVPVIDGDPFTDSQEYPTRFAVSPAVVRGSSATVAVRFGDGYRDRTIRYALRSTGATWRIDDVHYEAGSTLRALLR
ncbi:MAG: hypothetical protein IPP90_06090 [Gemmatimonadaceae bacterium]|nr:hypothetical protein [Gemmatimonadaceae bacterium]